MVNTQKEYDYEHYMNTLLLCSCISLSMLFAHFWYSDPDFPSSL